MKRSSYSVLSLYIYIYSCIQLPFGICNYVLCYQSRGLAERGQEEEQENDQH